MTFRILSAIFFTVMVSCSFAQVYEHGDGLIYDNGTNGSASYGFAIDQQGNTYGSMFMSTGWDVYFPGNVPSGSGKAKIFKHDNNGNLIWTMAGGDNAVIRDIQIDAFGNIYLCGYQSYGLLTATNCPNFENYTDFVAKLNPAGSFDWMTRVPGRPYITTTTGGKVGFALKFDPTNGGVPYLGSTVMSGMGYEEHIVLGEIESNGNVAWYDISQDPLPGFGNGSVDGVAYNNGKLYYCGYYDGTFDFGGTSFVLDNYCVAYRRYDMFLAEMDVSNQSIVSVVSTDQLHIRAMEFDQNNNIVFAFQHNNEGGTCNPSTGGFMGATFPLPDYDGYIIKTDDQYNLIAVHDLGGPYTGQAHKAYVSDLQVEGDNVYVAFQSFYNPGGLFQVDPSAPNTADDSHFYVMRLDDSLNYKYHTAVMSNDYNNAPKDVLIDCKGDELSSIMHTTSPFTSLSFSHHWFIGGYKTNANLIEGIVFRDFNYNDTYDSGDIPYGGSIINIVPSPYLMTTQLDGTFSAYVDAGTYEISLASIPANYNPASPLTSVTFSGNNMTAFAEVPIIPTPNVDDIEIAFYAEDQLVIEEETKHNLIVENVGTTIQDVYVEIDPLDLPFAPGDITASSGLTLVNNVYRDTIYSMLPGDTVHYEVYYYAPISMLMNIGDVGSTSASATTTNTDVTPQNNNADFSQTLLASYDPNIKEVQEPYLLDYASLNDVDYIHYTIHFQNEGNYPAANVRIYDEIENDLMLNSLKIIDASDAVSCSIDGNALQFHFDGIMLPPKSSDELGSRGFVHFKLLRSPSLTIGDSIINSADIYFDDNPPIITNNAVNIVFLDDAGIDAVQNDIHIVAYPNPIKDVLYLVSDDSKIQSLKLFTISGQQIALNASSNNQINTSGLESGMYLLKVGTDAGTTLIRLVKE